MPSFSCPHCHRKGRAPANLAGQQVSCPHCRQPFLVPLPQAVPEAPPPVNVHVHEPADRDLPPPWPRHIAPRLSAVAILLWILVFLVSLLCTVGAVVSLFQNAVPPEGIDHNLYAQLRDSRNSTLLLVLLVSGYVLARAVDRLTQ